MGQERKLRLGPDRLGLPRGAFNTHEPNRDAGGDLRPDDIFLTPPTTHPFPRRSQVCVRMDERFLANSASVDGNDLSSVVGHGEHWCVCAWAFASAVDRDPNAMEGLHLTCEESHAQPRPVRLPTVGLRARVGRPPSMASSPLRRIPGKAHEQVALRQPPRSQQVPIE